MKTKKYWFLAVVIGVFALQLWAGFDIKKLTLKQQSLVGIDAMYVSVDELPKNAKEAGLTKRQIQTDIELKLRREGIKVVTSQEEWLKLSGSPYLFVTIQSLKLEELPVFAYSITVELKQGVFLMRNRNISNLATTWNEHRVGCAGEKVFVSSTRRYVSDFVDIFLNDYLAANPKEPDVWERAAKELREKAAKEKDE
ncbi:MAG: hypothetical protein WBC22_16800 [Sedimentisphaerales bacterium]